MDLRPSISAACRTSKSLLPVLFLLGLWGPFVARTRGWLDVDYSHHRQEAGYRRELEREKEKVGEKYAAHAPLRT